MTDIPPIPLPRNLAPIEVLRLAAELASVLNLRTQGFRRCRVSDDSTGLCYSFDTISDAQVFLDKRTRSLRGKPVFLFARGAEVYEYRDQKTD
ncbi:hypothetical protein JIN84_00015 [Luteolibacter yonseiensis]|uniref:Uncharacterized protein n=1 Tax=Luteolibacter yonseiensis TaxID=1144680 RepID=A0A934R0C6_9BACT|nr:hypothetical protein [Luteolibacter yonseiensis]MBK1813991.1 hypothetical protein [Luteolibacter yonseiensis]